MLLLRDSEDASVFTLAQRERERERESDAVGTALDDWSLESGGDELDLDLDLESWTVPLEGA
jgi:hypothetical protein